MTSSWWHTIIKGDPTDPNTHQLISSLSVVGKWYDSMPYKELLSWTEYEVTLGRTSRIPQRNHRNRSLSHSPIHWWQVYQLKRWIASCCLHESLTRDLDKDLDILNNSSIDKCLLFFIKQRWPAYCPGSSSELPRAIPLSREVKQRCILASGTLICSLICTLVIWFFIFLEMNFTHLVWFVSEYSVFYMWMIPVSCQDLWLTFSSVDIPLWNTALMRV